MTYSTIDPLTCIQHSLMGGTAEIVMRVDYSVLQSLTGVWWWTGTYKNYFFKVI